MTTKLKGATAAGMESSTKQTAISEVTQKLQTKLQNYASLADKVKRRNLFQQHLDKIEGLKIEPESNFENEQSADSAIIIKIGYRDEYEIKNRALMEEVRKFIVSKIHVHMEQLDSEILASEL